MRQHLARIGLSLALLLLLAGTVAYGAMAAPQATTHVVQFPYLGPQYSPATVLIQMGDTVQWDGNFVAHPLVSDDGLWSASSGATFSYTFNQPGTYRYYCLAHGAPGGVGMAGEVIVTANPVQRVSLPALLR